MISKILQILGIQPRISKFFLTVGQNNFGNKIPFLLLLVPSAVTAPSEPAAAPASPKVAPASIASAPASAGTTSSRPQTALPPPALKSAQVR